MLGPAWACTGGANTANEDASVSQIAGDGGVRLDAAVTDAAPPSDASAPDSGRGDGGVRDAAVGTDAAAPPDAAAIPDAAVPVDFGDAGPVPVLVAQGHNGRITVSCDDGRTWVANRSRDDALRCFTDDADGGFIDCDHNAWAGRGLASGGGVFVATWGWGYPGQLQRSVDGVTWTTVQSGSTFADVAYGNGLFMANDRTPLVSPDGVAWSTRGDADPTPWNVRAIAFFPYDTGRFVIAAESDTRDIVVSADNGNSWAPSAVRPDGCGGYVQGMAYGNGVGLIASGSGHVCYTTNGAQSWTQVQVTGEITSPPVWTGSQFMVWNYNTAFMSADGANWTSQPVTPSSVNIGAVTRSVLGTLVASRGGWEVWYQDQQFYRSTDGIAWEVLPAGAFVGSHPINFIEGGWARPSATCPPLP